MHTISNQHLTGERALFKSRDLHVETSIFDDGESPLKESRDVEVVDSVFGWKYPLWYCDHVRVSGTAFLEMARAGIWYTRDVTITDSTYQAPKGLRKCHDVRLERVQMAHADETLWWNDGVELVDVTATGDYFCQGSRNVHATRLQLTGNYGFDGCENVVIEDSRLLTKDAFWNCENVVVRNSLIVGEYLAWNARNVRLEHCTIQSEQGLCYVENLTLRDCQLIETTLAFEYCSDVDAEVTTPIVSVKNPYNGRIVAPSIGEVIWDDPEVDRTKTEIVLTDAAAGGEKPCPCPCLCRVA